MYEVKFISFGILKKKQQQKKTFWNINKIFTVTFESNAEFLAEKK